MAAWHSFDMRSTTMSKTPWRSNGDALMARRTSRSASSCALRATASESRVGEVTTERRCESRLLLPVAGPRPRRPLGRALGPCLPEALDLGLQGLRMRRRDRAGPLERAGAFLAEPRRWGILVLAGGTLHAGASLDGARSG